MIGLRKRRDSSLKSTIKHGIIVSVIFLLLILIVYLIIDSTVSQDYITDTNQIVNNGTYREGFEKLVSDIRNNVPTGIPSIDDSGVSYGEKVEITKGSGDFVEVKPAWDTKTKSYTSYNNRNWSTTAPQYTFAYSKLLHKESTLYERSGIVKLFDRYTWTAVGKYWSKRFNLSTDTGSTYRVFLDTGATYDIICFDVKADVDGNPNASGYVDRVINAPNGLSIAHGSQPVNSLTNSLCFTEFDVINFDTSYPIREASGSQHPKMEYNKLLTLKDDVTHIETDGGYQVIPEFRGNVIAFQVIDDPKVKDILKLAEQEVAEYK